MDNVSSDAKLFADEESVQYSAALAVSGAWKGTNMDRLYEELGWEPLYYRRWQRRLSGNCQHKFIKSLPNFSAKKESRNKRGACRSFGARI